MCCSCLKTEQLGCHPARSTAMYLCFFVSSCPDVLVAADATGYNIYGPIIVFSKEGPPDSDPGGPSPFCNAV